MRNDLIICTLLIACICSAACSRGSCISEEKKSNATSPASVAKDDLRKKVEEKLNDMLVAQFQVDRDTISSETLLIEDLKADELDLVEMILRIEDGFEISIPDDVARKLNRVSEFYDYVEKRLRENLSKQPGVS